MNNRNRYRMLEACHHRIDSRIHSKINRTIMRYGLGVEMGTVRMCDYVTIQAIRQSANTVNSIWMSKSHEQLE